MDSKDRLKLLRAAIEYATGDCWDFARFLFDSEDLEALPSSFISELEQIIKELEGPLVVVLSPLDNPEVTQGDPMSRSAMVLDMAVWESDQRCPLCSDEEVNKEKSLRCCGHCGLRFTDNGSYSLSDLKKNW